MGDMVDCCYEMNLFLTVVDMFLYGTNLFILFYVLRRIEMSIIRKSFTTSRVPHIFLHSRSNHLSSICSCKP
ncbi:hypothetical protein L2E82_16423 [Cichorium intybus]|uniref:Uncharacterized protein n=1 Tax=Cichorium intybus TaxID=13427 RepID=A0ACB9F6H4_CICIN|nr:hypothetical protein L2E82_16423 [Cichorium intybus]